MLFFVDSQLNQVNKELQKTNDVLHSDIEKLKQENQDLSTKAHAGYYHSFIHINVLDGVFNLYVLLRGLT